MVDASVLLAQLYLWYRFTGGSAESRFGKLLRWLSFDNPDAKPWVMRPYQPGYPRLDAPGTRTREKRRESAQTRATPSGQTIRSRKGRELRLAYGIAPRERAIWWHKDLVATCASKAGYRTQHDRVFSKAFHRRTVEFVDDGRRLSDWLEGRVDISMILDDAIDAEFLAALGVPFEARYECIGTVAVGTERDFVWIGFTDDLSLVREPDERVRAHRIQQLVAPFPLAISSAPAWVRIANVVDAIRSGEAVSAPFAREVMRNTLPFAWESIAASPLVDFTRSAKLDGFVRKRVGFWYTTPRDTENENSLRNGLVSALSGLGGARVPEWLVVITPLSFAEIAPTIRRVTKTGSEFAVRILVVDGSALGCFVGARPWLWSKHFGKHLPFHVIESADDDALAEALLPRGTTARTGEAWKAIVDKLVDQAAREFSRLDATSTPRHERPCTPQERAFAATLTRDIDELVQAARPENQVQRPPADALAQEEWAKRFLLPETLARLDGTFLSLLSRVEPPLLAGALAWYAALADDEQECANRLAAALPRALFHDKLPVCEELLRPEIGHFPFSEDEHLRMKYAGMVQWMIRPDDRASVSDPVMQAELASRRVRRFEKACVLIGRDGTGVRTSLYQLVRREHAGATVIVLSAAFLAGIDQDKDDQSLLFSIIGFLAQAAREVVIVGHRTCATDADLCATRERVHALLKRYRLVHDRAFVRIGITTSAASMLITPPESGDLLPVVLGRMGRRYATRLVSHLVSVLGIDMDAEAITTLASRCAEREAPQELVARFFSLPENRLTQATVEEWYPSTP